MQTFESRVLFWQATRQEHTSGIDMWFALGPLSRKLVHKVPSLVELGFRAVLRYHGFCTAGEDVLPRELRDVLAMRRARSLDLARDDFCKEPVRCGVVMVRRNKYKLITTHMHLTLMLQIDTYIPRDIQRRLRIQVSTYFDNRSVWILLRSYTKFKKVKKCPHIDPWYVCCFRYGKMEGSS